ncbi:cAMP-responsive element modulator-like [Engraulis encrasicolus]|uniref:cAMP-responsive element modulator-like n=1 Tax=Engraulis encrasicolus TaxID=184585 RepID=UPI002FCF8744
MEETSRKKHGGPKGSSVYYEHEDSEQGREAQETGKRREYPRRAHRKVVNMPSDAPVVPKIEDKGEANDSPNVPPVPMPTSIFQTATGQYIAFTQNGAIQLTNAAGEGLQPLPMHHPSGGPPPGPPMGPYATQSGDAGQHYYMPANKMTVQAATGDMSAYQMHPPAPGLPQGVMMGGSPGPMHGHGHGHGHPHHTEEATRKRELRLLKNREAAKECRRRKREYVRCLETRVTSLEQHNKSLEQHNKKLQEELQYLKDIYQVQTN